MHIHPCPDASQFLNMEPSSEFQTGEAYLNHLYQTGDTLLAHGSLNDVLVLVAEWAQRPDALFARMQLMSWNVNGLRAVVKKGFTDQIEALGPNVLGLQETKAQDDQVREAFFGWDTYELHSSSAVEKGVFPAPRSSPNTDLSVQAGIGVQDWTRRTGASRGVRGISFCHGLHAQSEFRFEALAIPWRVGQGSPRLLARIGPRQAGGVLWRPERRSCPHRPCPSSGELQQDSRLHATRNRRHGRPATSWFCGHLEARPS